MFLRTIAFVILGMAIGWAGVVLLEDLKIKKDQMFRKVRAIFFTLLLLLYTTVLASQNLAQAGIFFISAAATLAVFCRRKN